MPTEEQTARIIVGYDGSAHSGAAVDWAALEAQRRGLGLTVLHVIDYRGMIPGAIDASPWPDLAWRADHQLTAKGVERARAKVPSIDVRPAACSAQVAYGLIEKSKDAALLVVGTRGHGELAGAVLGSVAFAVTAHARCPVVVVRGDSGLPPGPDRPVVVGLDGSGGSDLAARFAADIASDCGAPLVLITAYPSAGARIWAESAAYQAETDACLDLDAIARMNAGQITSTAYRAAREAHPELAVRQQLIEGPVAEVLSTAARDCGLLVVGSRGRGGFTGLLLGSVSHDVIHSAPCPVAVVRDAGAVPATDRAPAQSAHA
jgi:nucleotide-binding universal stress UspA family protein